MLARGLVVFVVVGLVACGGGGTGDDDIGPTPCTSDAECSGTTPACDVPAMTCVQCTDTNAAACTGATANCSADHTCAGACAADADCLSGVCLGDGVCADPGRVLWVSRDVTGTTCTPDDKCTFATALGLAAAPRDIIHVDPLGYQLAAGITIDKDVHVVGRAATFVAAAGTALRVIDGADVTIDGLAIGGAPGMNPDTAVECTNAKLRVRVATVQHAALVGINASGCTLAVQRSSVHDNGGGGLQLGGGGVFTLSNNFIFRNGSGSATGGGIEVLGSVPDGSSLEFNTIVDNHAGPGGNNAGGVVCRTPAFAAPNNLIARNDVNGNAGAANAQTVGACTYPTSIRQAAVTDLAFASPDVAPFDYTIRAGSAAIDMATTPSPIDIDHGGDARPQGAAKDIGADELVP
ncbi:MAG: hypothetical protein KIT31_28975 [Deltaproteobacteria bacterium]|nr:hypothetical protein [Deltaproteobacteria bacterium]